MFLPEISSLPSRVTLPLSICSSFPGLLKQGPAGCRRHSRPAPGTESRPALLAEIEVLAGLCLLQTLERRSTACLTWSLSAPSSHPHLQGSSLRGRPHLCLPPPRVRALAVWAQPHHPGPPLHLKTLNHIYQYLVRAAGAVHRLQGQGCATGGGGDHGMFSPPTPPQATARTLPALESVTSTLISSH